MKQLTSEEVKELEEIEQGYSLLSSQLGHLEAQKLVINHKIKKIEDELLLLYKSEEEITQKLYNKYGEGEISYSEGKILKL